MDVVNIFTLVWLVVVARYYRCHKLRRWSDCDINSHVGLRDVAGPVTAWASLFNLCFFAGSLPLAAGSSSSSSSWFLPEIDPFRRLHSEDNDNDYDDDHSDDDDQQMSSTDLHPGNPAEDDPFSHVTQNASSASTAGAPVDDTTKFMGQKERRKSSSSKQFLGDNLSLSTNQSVLKVLAKNGIS